MRPDSIRKFDMFYLGSLAISLAASVVGYEAVKAQAEAEAAGSGVEVGSGLVTASMAAGLLISLVLWYLVSRKGFSIAKWIVVLLFALGLMNVPRAFAGGLSTFEMISLASVVLQAIAIWYLFQPDSKAWFASDRGTEPDAPVDPVD